MANPGEKEKLPASRGRGSRFERGATMARRAGRLAARKEADKKQKERDSNFQKKRSGGGRRFPRPILIVALLGVVAVVVWLLFQSLPKPAGEGEVLTEDNVTAAGFDFIKDKENRNIIHIKPPFYLNLAGLEGRYMMLVTVWLEVSDKAVVNELNDNQAKYFRMIDDLIRILKSYTYAELAVGSGMLRMKEEIKRRVNQYLERGKVRSVFFPEIYFDKILARPEIDR